MQSFELTVLAWLCLGGPTTAYILVRVFKTLMKVREMNNHCKIGE